MELIHTCYRITDPDRSVAFYQALGFEERRRMPIRDEAINIFMGLPGDGDRLELTYNFGVDSYELGTGYGHVAVTVSDLDATLEQLAGQGIEPEKPPYTVREGGARLCFVRSGRLQGRAHRARRAELRQWRRDLPHRQGVMATLGAELADVAAGRVAIALPIEARLSQQDGFLHAGVVVTALDSACGYAALTLMPDEAEVLTVELKVNLLAPASGDSLVAEGEAVRAGRTLTVCRGDAYAEQDAERCTRRRRWCAGTDERGIFWKIREA